MTKHNIYLQRYAAESVGLAEKITGNPDMIVVIPVHRETELVKPLESLHSCIPPTCEVAIFLVVNESEDASQSVQQVNGMAVAMASQLPTLYEQHICHIQLPAKKAGVGLARKVGMDEAVRYFESKNKDGVIICYDADCLCAPNYLQAIEEFFDYSQNNLGLVHYEHQLAKQNHEAIIHYELFLRYYINGLRIAKYPFSVQTLGSCITVRSSAYQKQGGMNQRQAGEDFYFIHKFTKLGGIGEINTTTVYPSSRVSDRVPFGTGHAIQKYLNKKSDTYQVYHPQTFENLKCVNRELKHIYETGEWKSDSTPVSISSFYYAMNFPKDLQEILNQAGSFDNFVQRYYQWWDGFKVLKYVHYVRDQYYKPIPLPEALEWLSKNLNLAKFPKTKEDQLRALRKYDKTNLFYIK